MSKLAAFILCSACALYISIPVVGKPYNVLFIISFFLSMLIVFNNKKIVCIDAALFCFLIFVFYFCKFIFVDNYANYFFIFNAMNFIMALIVMSSVDLKYNLILVRYSVLLTFLVFAFEAYFRFTNPYFGGVAHSSSIDNVDLSDNFYIYKVNSLMYLNSNGVGMHAVFLFSLILYVKTHLEFIRKSFFFYKSELNFYLFFSLVFCALSLSRGAVLICIVILMLYFFEKLKSFYKYISILPLIPVFSLFIFFIYEKTTQDESFNTKFQILNNLIFYLKSTDIFHLLFGNIYGDPYKLFYGFVGFVGHTHYFELIFFGGLLGLLFFTLFFLTLCNHDRYLFLFFIVPFVLLGFSNIRIFAHYLFFYLGWALILKNKIGRVGSFEKVI